MVSSYSHTKPKAIYMDSQNQNLYGVKLLSCFLLPPFQIIGVKAITSYNLERVEY